MTATSATATPPSTPASRLGAPRRVGQVLSVVSQKGGVGKTTTAVNLAAAFARRGLRTLLVDVDPQGAVRYGAGLRRGHPTYGFFDYISGRTGLREIILPTQLPWLRVLLVGTVTEEANHAGYQALVANTDVLRDVLTEARSRCDIVIVDTPPGLGAIVRRSLEASQHALVTLQCEPLALQTTPQILRAIQDIASTNAELTLDGILLTMYEASNPACVRVADYVREHLPADMVLDTVIPRTAASADAFAAGQPVVLRDPADAAAQAYVNLATILAERFQ
jgi:chromosome partitioning protein